MRPQRILALVLVISGLATACGGGSETQTSPADESAAATGATPTADGGQIDFGSLEGTDTVLWFWAPW